MIRMTWREWIVVAVVGFASVTSVVWSDRKWQANQAREERNCTIAFTLAQTPSDTLVVIRRTPQCVRLLK